MLTPDPAADAYVEQAAEARREGLRLLPTCPIDPPADGRDAGHDLLDRAD